MTQKGLDWFMNKDRPTGWDGRGLSNEIERLKVELAERDETIKQQAEELAIVKADGDHWRNAYSKWCKTDVTAIALKEAEQTVAEQAAQIERLSQAAKPFLSGDIVDETGGTIPLMKALREAIESTPGAALAKIRADYLRKLAPLFDTWYGWFPDGEYVDNLRDWLLRKADEIEKEAVTVDETTPKLPNVPLKFTPIEKEATLNALTELGQVIAPEEYKP